MTNYIGVVRGLESLGRLNAARELLERFAEAKNVDALDARQRDLLNEARFRMQQVSRLLEMVIQLMGDHAAKGGLDHELMFDLQIMTESWYYFSHRAIKALRRQQEFKNLDVKGIRTVRNELIDHPDGGNSGVLDMTFIWSGATGPIVKGARTLETVDIHRDAGLWANVDEFSASLAFILTRIVE